MLRRAVLAAVVALLLLPGLAAAQKPITLWHVFNLDTDIIYIGIKSFNESQNTHRIEPRLVPANQLSAELIKAIATGSVPDLVTIDNPNVASFAAQDR
jgi:multiple sugar transport system substrate-binding protein